MRLLVPTAIVLALGAVVTQSMWRRSPQRAARPPAILFESSKVGKAPSDFIQCDLSAPSRLYSGTSLSTDGGKNWAPLADSSGRRAVLLGGPHAFPPVAGPDGRVAFAHVMFEDPSVPFGHGEIADVVEWSGIGWNVLEAEDGQPNMDIVELQYEPTTQNVFATRRDQLLRYDRGLGQVTSYLVTSDLTSYAATAGPFPLVTHPLKSATWLPVPLRAAVRDLAEGKAGSLYVAADQLGRKAGEVWRWTKWPERFVPVRLVVHPRKRDWLAIVGTGDRLLISLDGGVSLHFAPASGVVSASWDRHDDSLLYVTRGGDLYRLHVRQPPDQVAEK